MAEIKKVAVVGSGVMGASIAAHMANAGTPVLLFDIVPQGATRRSQLAENAIAKLAEIQPAPLTHPKKAKLITPCNLEDDLAKLADVDWIIEAVLEKLEVKHDVYKKLDSARKKGSIVSSNTSTIPLARLVDGMPEQFRKDFLITHFFNPPRYMRLLELVQGVDSRKDAAETIRVFADVKLGKGVVDCKDTPGFIANRIGCYWLEAGLLHAIDQKVSVEEADAVMGKPVGIPKTGVFGLMDLIGIDLLPLIAKAFGDTLPASDGFRQIYRDVPVVNDMIKNGYTGRKGKGGFYRMNKSADGKKTKESVNLQTGEYSPSKDAKLESVTAAKEGLRALVTHPDKGGKYAWAVLRDTLHYTAGLMPEIADDIPSVDEAMRNGYNWKYGPFELIDKFGTKDQAGPAWFAAQLEKEGLSVPAVIKNAGDKPFYAAGDGTRLYLDLNGRQTEFRIAPDAWMLADKKSSKTLVTKNGSASLWDIGDGIACLEFTSKMNSLDPSSLELIAKATGIVKEKFKGLVVANDGDNFCVGANIGVLLFAANTAAWKTIDGIIKQGQDTYMGLKYAPFPVVCAPTGMALGGGCEILLHADAVQAHIELYTGLVEVGVGVIPGWGGCKELILRTLEERRKDDSAVAKLGGMFSFISPLKTLNTMPALSKAFENISTARVSKSAEDAKSMLILNERSRITMNRMRLLPDAKKTCLELAQNYAPPASPVVNMPGKTAKKAFEMAVASFVKSGKATPHDQVVSMAVAEVISGGPTDITKEVTEQYLLDLEREAFVELCKNKNTMARIEHMLDTGKPLRN